MLVESAGRLVLGMHHDGSNPDDIGSANDAAERVSQQGSAQSLSLPGAIDGEAGKQNDRDGVACQAFSERFRCFSVLDLGGAQAVVADDVFASDGNVGLGGAGVLICEREPPKVGVERLRSAIEAFDGVSFRKLLDA